MNANQRVAYEKMCRDNPGLGGFFEEAGKFVTNTWTSVTDLVPAAVNVTLAPIRFTAASTSTLASGGGIDAVMKDAGRELGAPAKAAAVSVAPILPFVPYGTLVMLAITVDNLRIAKAKAADNQRESDAIQAKIDAIEARIAALKAGTAVRSAGSIVGAQSAIQSSSIQSPEYDSSGAPKKKIPWVTIGIIGATAAATLL